MGATSVDKRNSDLFIRSLVGVSADEGLGLWLFLALVSLEDSQGGRFFLVLLCMESPLDKDVDYSEEYVQIVLLDGIDLAATYLLGRGFFCDLRRIQRELNQLLEPTKFHKPRQPHLTQLSLLSVLLQHLVIVNEERLENFKDVHSLMEVVRLEQGAPHELLRDKLGRVVKPKQRPEELKVRIKHPEHLGGLLVYLRLE